MQTQEIQPWVQNLSQNEAEECLANLRGLAGHLEVAMDAIVKRQLISLQGSVQLQNTRLRHSGRCSAPLQSATLRRMGTVTQRLSIRILRPKLNQQCNLC